MVDYFLEISSLTPHLQELRTFEVGVEYMSDAEKINIANQDLVDIYNKIAKARREIIRELFSNSWEGDDWREEPLHKDQENFYCPAGTWYLPVHAI